MTEPAAVSYDQVSAAATRTRTASLDVDAAVGGLTAQRHDAATVAEASAAMEALDAAARSAYEAQLAAANAADLAERIPPLGVDPELERMEFIVSFHESGHAVYAEQSKLMVPVTAEIDVKRGMFVGPAGCGVVMVMFTKPMNRWTERDFINDAACSIAGSTAAAYWRQRVEGAEFGSALRDELATGGSVDHAYAWDAVADDPKAFRKAERLAYQAVTERWDRIAGMAEILRDKERMSRGQISRAA